MRSWRMIAGCAIILSAPRVAYIGCWSKCEDIIWFGAPMTPDIPPIRMEAGAIVAIEGGR